MTTEHKAGVDYTAVLADLEAKKTEIENTIKGIQAIMRIAPSAGTGGIDVGHPTSHQPHTLRDNSFFGMTVMKAIKAYLGMTHRTPRAIQEIVDSLGRGGLPTNPNSVSSILSRKADSEGVINVGRKWGLQEWYPGARIKKVKQDSGEGDQVEEAAKEGGKKVI